LILNQKKGHAMAAISLLTVPGAQPVLESTAGTAMMATSVDLLVRAVRRKVELATGGTLQPLKGVMVLQRGETTILEDGKTPRAGGLTHLPARGRDKEYGPRDESFRGDGYLADVEFDRVVQLCQAGCELEIELDFVCGGRGGGQARLRGDCTGHVSRGSGRTSSLPRESRAAPLARSSRSVASCSILRRNSCSVSPGRHRASMSAIVVRPVNASGMVRPSVNKASGCRTRA
jgi:hypothetical protein